METKTYTIKCKKGYVGDFAFEWDIDGKEREAHNKFVEECIADGTFGEEFEVTMTLIPLSQFDDPVKTNIFDKNNYSYKILNFSDEGK